MEVLNKVFFQIDILLIDFFFLSIVSFYIAVQLLGELCQRLQTELETERQKKNGRKHRRYFEGKNTIQQKIH